MAPEMKRRQPRVLVVDDESGVVHTACTILRRRGFYAEGANDGDDAIARVRDVHFDVVLMDIRMPGVDGVTALRTIRRLPDAPVVALMTAFSTTSVLQEAMEAGARDVLLKPMDFDMVIQLVSGVPARQSVLVVDADGARAAALADALRRHGRAARVASRIADAVATCSLHPTTDVIVVDCGLAAPPERLAALRGLLGSPAVVLVAPRADAAGATPDTIVAAPGDVGALVAALDQLPTAAR